ncbi:MAG: glycoside hydrolase family 2 [Bryobacterales bacterium]|nr:glycoside hydrolase family 2 [Bryobacterales bacterium]
MKASALFLAAAAFLPAADIPRPEYPQPQFQRSDWFSLNGPWEFEFDDSNVGQEQNWGSSGRKFSRTIKVPFCFESKLSGIGDTSFHPFVWYRRAFTLPAGWPGRRVLLQFGAVDYHATVWVNGKMAGSHEGGHTPFRFDVTPMLQTGANTIVVRAEDPPTDRFLPRGKQYWEPKSRGIFYTRTTGIWQSVWMEAAGESYLEQVRVTPSNDGTVRFEARVARPAPGVAFHAEVKFGGQTVAESSARLDGPRATSLTAIPDPKLWSVAAPQLYDVVFELRRDGKTVDHVASYFGFRSVDTASGRFLLNGRPTYLKMVLDQGYWPESTLTPPSDEAIQYDIRMTKEMGFNGARKHQKLEDPRFLYWADRLGLLVSSEMANAYLFDERYAARFTREWIEAVERDYNHPSIVMWIPINESWGVPNSSDLRQQNHLKSLYYLTKSLDPSRPVIDNDGWEHTDTTDLFGIHDYARNGDVLRAKYKDLGKPGAAVPPNGRAALAPGYKYNGSPVFLSEFGGIAFLEPGQKAAEGAWGYAGVEPSIDAALTRLRSLYQAIADTPAIMGICYTQLTDVEQEINGLLTYDRKPKFDSKTLRDINALIP